MVVRRIGTLGAFLAATAAIVATSRAASAAPDAPTVADEPTGDVPGEVVVDVRDDVALPAIETMLSAWKLSFDRTALADETRAFVVHVAAGREAETIAELESDPRVEYAEPLGRVHALFVPDDPLLAQQWHLDRVGVRAAWDFATGRGATVAVVDTGIACEAHGPYAKATDLAETTCLPGWNFVAGDAHANDDNGHGTHVAGTIAQSTDNGLGAAGVAFRARLLPVKVLNAGGWGTTAAVADGIRFAADHGADVVNLSLGGSRDSKILQRAIDHARVKGVVVVAAAGNSGASVQYPGASRGVVGVSATDPSDTIARFSSRGPQIDLAAPGVDVVQQTICDGGKNECERFPGYSGTSMASPHVAGAAALLVSAGVSAPDAVEARLEATARAKEERELYGAGLLDVAAALRRTALVHALVRTLAAAALALLALRSAKRSRRGRIRVGPSFLLALLATGPGLFFFAPWVASREPLPLDLLARPIGDLDLLVSAHMHRWLPLANALVPFALVALGYGVRRLRPALAGFALGTAGYLASVALLGESVAPLGRALLVVWCAANALACVVLGRTCLVED